MILRNTPFFILFILASFGSFAQVSLPVDSNGAVIFDEVVTVDSITSKQFFNSALEWFATTFKSAKDVIEMQNPETSTIIGKGNTKIFWPGMLGMGTNGYLSFTLKVSAKDNRYKYTFGKLKYQDQQFKYSAVNIDELVGKNNKMADKARKNVNDAINSLSESLKKSMAKNDNW